MAKENKEYNYGFIPLQRTILEWQWYQNSNVARLFIHILLKSNFKSKMWQGHKIKEGEFITSIDKLHVELGISTQSIRTTLDKLEKTGYIQRKSTNKFTRIKLVESDVYSIEKLIQNKQINNQRNIPKTYGQQTDNNQSTTANKEKKEIEYKQSKQVFQAELDLYKNKYPKNFLISFFYYWTEESRQTGRPKFLDEKYWNLESRLANWKQYPKPEIKNSHLKNRNYGKY
jgi:DNA-binding MarR family transcriptional regulator